MMLSLQPFHDFPMGPDWWSGSFFAAIATQMAKMRFNMWGFHTYPVGGPTEPFVWVGVEDVRCIPGDGKIA